MYEVSDLGRVRSLPRKGARGRILKPYGTGYYLSVTLSSHGAGRSVNVHPLVARAFLGPPPDGMVVRHGPGRERDNRLANLSYGTLGQNSADRYRDGTINAKLTEDIVREIRARVAAGESRSSLARRFGVRPSTVGLVVKGETWRHVPVIPVPPRPPRGARSTYGLIARRMEAAIRAGDLAAGTILPLLWVIAEQNGVSPSTASRAVSILEAKGLVITTGRRAGWSVVHLAEMPPPAP